MSFSLPVLLTETLESVCGESRSEEIIYCVRKEDYSETFILSAVMDTLLN